MLRCPACGTTTHPLRHLTVTPRRPYRCGGCGTSLVAAPSLSTFAGLLAVWLLVFLVLDLLRLPMPLRLPLVAVVAVLVLWLLLPLRPVEDPPREQDENEDQP
jgi:membrane protein implicated in regulation of membrane protease activity